MHSIECRADAFDVDGQMGRYAPNDANYLTGAGNVGAQAAQAAASAIDAESQHRARVTHHLMS